MHTEMTSEYSIPRSHTKHADRSRRIVSQAATPASAARRRYQRPLNGRLAVSTQRSPDVLVTHPPAPHAAMQRANDIPDARHFKRNVALRQSISPDWLRANDLC